MAAAFEDGAIFEDGGCNPLIYKKMAKMAAQVELGGCGQSSALGIEPKGRPSGVARLGRSIFLRRAFMLLFL
jgi:hypothetical protein